MCHGQRAGRETTEEEELVDPKGSKTVSVHKNKRMTCVKTSTIKTTVITSGTFTRDKRL